MSKNTECFLNSITGLYSLEILILRGGRLKELPRDITNWNKLKHLYLCKNKNIEFLPNSITGLNNLEKLIVTGYEKVKELPQDIKNLIHLQHLDLQGNSNIEFLPNSITKLCELKILILQGCTKLKELPRDVENWIDLRYLDLSSCGIEFLPDSITQLKNLETLLLRCCGRLKEWSGNAKNLINLKHLDVHGCLALTHMPKGLGELTNLQTLNLFVLGKDKNSGGLSELKGLNTLRGSLTIKGLQFCTTFELQRNAQFLKLKPGLQELVLEWKWDEDSFNEPITNALDDDYERVLECLHPHSNLQEMCIKGYRGVKLCNWLSSPSYSFDCLVRMEFLSCKRLQHLPQFDQFPNLKVLRLEELPRIKHIACNIHHPCSSNFFPSLEELTISRMRHLKTWWNKGQTSTSTIIFPCLSQLDIVKDCPLLTSKPLEMNDDLDDVEVSWKSFETLSCLRLGFISEWEFLSNCLRHVTNLQQLSIRHCPNLTSLPESIANLTSLTQFEIASCLDLMSLPESIDNLTSLTQLEIANCPNLMSLPKSMGNLTSLTQLEIWSCTRLASLPDGIRHLHSLQSLTIESCPILEKRYKKETGEDWLKIAHIHYVNIS